MKKKRNISLNTKLILSLIFATLAMSIGYAVLTGTTLSITGVANIAQDGDVKITSITTNSTSNVTENTPAAIINDGKGISFDLNVVVDSTNYNQDFYITYLISIENDSISDQKILSTNFTPTFTGSGTPPVTSFDITDSNGVSMLNDTIPAKTTKSYYLTIRMKPSETGSWGVEGETNVDTGATDTGVVIGSITGSTQGNLTGSNTLAHFTAEILNSHDAARSFTLSIDSTKFQIVDQNGNSLPTMNINANDTSTYDFYIKLASGAKFMVSPQDLNVYLNCDGNTQSIGTISLVVDIDPTLSDFEAPIFSNVTVTQQSTDRTLTVSWGANDANTITNIYLEVYTSNASGNGSLYTSYTLAGTDRSKVVTVPSDNAYYYFKVYGIDQSSNTATSSEISSCSTSSGHCSKSANQIYKWHFTVTLNLTYATASSGSITTSGDNSTVVFNVNYDDSVSTTLSGQGNNRGIPESISSATIRYPGNSSDSTLPSGNSSQTAYSYDGSSGALNIYHIKGDINISATGKDNSCLVEGTEILLADGTSKKIEDIGYDDLLAVWSYDTGSLTYEYPLWIEKKHTDYQVTKVTLEDDSYIEFVNEHSVYNTDINLFVNIHDDENFHVGSHIAKLNDNNELVSMEVKDIELTFREVNHYFVGSTRYYNIFANRILTTDRNVMISNLYGFEDNAKWPKEKEEIVSNPNNIVKYEDFNGLLPHYLYKGFRAGEVGYLINQNLLSLPEFFYYISLYITNPDIVRSPINYNGNNYWMVTTSLDNVVNKKDFLRKEGSIYTLPYVDGVNEWFNTADNKTYKPGDEIIVDYGMHFIAK